MPTGHAYAIHRLQLQNRQKSYNVGCNVAEAIMAVACLRSWNESQASNDHQLTTIVVHNMVMLNGRYLYAAQWRCWPEVTLLQVNTCPHVYIMVSSCTTSMSAEYAYKGFKILTRTIHWTLTGTWFWHADFCMNTLTYLQLHSCLIITAYCSISTTVFMQSSMWWWLSLSCC